MADVLKKIFALSLLFLITSCTTTIVSPATQIEYTGQISEKGMSLNVKPPFWQWCVDLYKWIKN